ncbi:MAG: hypothetical protein Q8O55_08850 [Dehalococcoidales bacterium]|nr:hypothetical protein [Dehalococcoidales bacterium]
MNQPIWATPERQRVLDVLKRNLFAGRCTYGHTNCSAMLKVQQAIVNKIGLPDEDNPFIWIMRASMVAQTVQNSMTRDELRHIPQWTSTELKEYWKADDRDARSYLWQREKRHLHALPGIYHRGNYDSIRKSEDLAKQPQWQIVTLGVSAFTMGRTAKVFIPGLKATIWVDLAGLKPTSKNQKRKFYKYGEGKAPESLDEQIHTRCSQAVRRYLDN